MFSNLLSFKAILNKYEWKSILSFMPRHFNKCAQWLRTAIDRRSVCSCELPSCHVRCLPVSSSSSPALSCPAWQSTHLRGPENEFQQLFVYLKFDLTVVLSSFPDLRNHWRQRLLTVCCASLLLATTPKRLGYGETDIKSLARKSGRKQDWQLHPPLMLSKNSGSKLSNLPR